MITAFYQNKKANKKISVYFCGEKIRNEKLHEYLGVTLNRELTFKVHLHKAAVKLKTRIDLVKKLAGISWGAAVSVFWTSSIALAFFSPRVPRPSVRNKHPHRNVQLRKAMRIISGTVLSTNNLCY